MYNRILNLKLLAKIEDKKNKTESYFTESSLFTPSFCNFSIHKYKNSKSLLATTVKEETYFSHFNESTDADSALLQCNMSC